MKFLYLLIFTSFLFSCKKTGTEIVAQKIDSTAIVDSINAARIKINDSLRNSSKFGDISGTHIFLHNGIAGNGKVTFKKVKDNNDEYEIFGSLNSGKNRAEIKGFGIRVSAKHINFTGNISQNVDGKKYTRKGTQTFLSKDGGKTFRLQNMVNDEGFIEYIDIKL